MSTFDNSQPLLNQRRQMLLEHLKTAGPEHYRQSSWFSGAHSSDEALALNQLVRGVSARAIAAFDIDRCGAAACLAGHGALLMAQHEHLANITSEDVARFYGIHADWFDEHLDIDHPGITEYAEDHDQLDDLIAELGSDYVYWRAQIEGLENLIATEG